MLLLLMSMITYGQIPDKYEEYNFKEMTQEELTDLFGSLYDNTGSLGKVSGTDQAIKEVIINGNKITTVVFNYGAITKPSYLANIGDLVWNGLGYGFEFSLLVAAEVENIDGSVYHIVSDGHILANQGDYDPSETIKWGWLPREGYADPDQTEIATLSAEDSDYDGKPDSWPDRWYLPGAGTYAWPAFLGDQATAPDEEVYWVMDDFTNAEFPYYPFPDDSTKRGLGLKVEARVLQYNNPLVEDILFVVFDITNESPKRLPKLYFGMHGDPHIGGASDYNDDKAFFIPPLGPLAETYPQRARNMVFAWDTDMKGLGGARTGFFGWKLLETPSNHWDNEDNDDDGLTDESPNNSAGRYIDGTTLPLNFGISDMDKFVAVYGDPVPRFEGDEDGDWDPDYDDIGIDGIPPSSSNYPGPDYGEGDGKPSQAFYLDANDNDKYDEGEVLSDEYLEGYKWAGSEPNFGRRDVSESDQIGLNSFTAAQYAQSSNVPKQDDLMWQWMSADYIDPDQDLLRNAGDNVFNFSTGPVALNPGESQRFSMAILFGDTKNDLVLNAETAYRVLEVDYRFARPPLKPIVKAVPGDGKVTLYWDDASEQSFDPFLRVYDFQGYKIYRSTDPDFSDIYTITDGTGSPYLSQPLYDSESGRYAQYDVDDSLSGFFPVEFRGRGVKYYIGDNTGLVHEYVDSTVQNGVTYYYAVVAYDSGNIPGEIPPSETQHVILTDPLTGELKFDVNTVEVTPNPLPTGVESAGLVNDIQPVKFEHNSTGKKVVKVLDDLKVKDKEYRIMFSDDVTYSLKDVTGHTETFISMDTVKITLSKQHIIEQGFTLRDKNGNVVSASDYTIDTTTSKISGSSVGSLPAGETFTATYSYYPIYMSQYLSGEDNNPDFDGMKLYMWNDKLDLDYEECKWLTNDEIDIPVGLLSPATVGQPIVKYRADWEFRWNDLDTNAAGEYENPGDVVTNQFGDEVVCPFTVWNISENVAGDFIVLESVPSTARNGKYDWNEHILLRPTDPTGTTTSYETWFIMPRDSVLDADDNFVLPGDGDVYLVKTSKPFRAGDEFVFETKAVEYKAENVEQAESEIYVVPNPYVAYSPSETPGRTPDLRGEKELQFRNLPPQCTIRIFTIMGELIQTIHKDDMSSLASWNLLTYEGQRVAYGVYIYHVETPGAPDHIGRIAIIK